MENFSELIKNRRSMRKFTGEELSQEDVVALLKAALMAPTSKRSNSWQFIAVDDKKLLSELSHCKEQASAFIADAALAIVVTADPLASDVWIEDASIASIMIQLQAVPANLLAVVGSVAHEKPMLNVCMSDDLVKDHSLNAGQMVREAAKLIQGGGGGQPHFAQAGGKNVDGLSAAVDKVVELAQL
jgi:nitroreductase